MIGRVYDDLRSTIRLIAGTRALSFAIFVSLALGIGAIVARSPLSWAFCQARKLTGLQDAANRNGNIKSGAAF